MEDSGTKGVRTRRTTAKTPAAATKAPAAPAKKAAAPKTAPAVRQAVEPKAPAAAATTVERDEMVRIAAYFHAERRGFAPGYEVADWLAAQAEVAERVAPATPAQPAKPAKAPAKKREGS
jgi:hypothetical protein